MSYNSNWTPIIILAVVSIILIIILYINRNRRVLISNSNKTIFNEPIVLTDVKSKESVVLQMIALEPNNKNNYFNPGVFIPSIVTNGNPTRKFLIIPSETDKTIVTLKNVYNNHYIHVLGKNNNIPSSNIASTPDNTIVFDKSQIEPHVTDPRFWFKMIELNAAVSTTSPIKTFQFQWLSDPSLYITNSKNIVVTPDSIPASSIKQKYNIMTLTTTPTVFKINIEPVIFR